jgi:hypothetical protein
VGENLDFPLYELEKISEIDDDEVDLEKAMKEYGLGINKNVLIAQKFKKNGNFEEKYAVHPIWVEEHFY